MLAYASHRRRIAERRPAPHAMLVIVAAHVAVIAAVMSAKLDLPQRIFRAPTAVELIPLPPPPPVDPQPAIQPKSSPSRIDRVPLIVPVPQPTDDTLDPTPVPIPQPGTGTIGPKVEPLPVPAPVRVAARFATPPSALRPPYPLSKIHSGEEAVLVCGCRSTLAGASSRLSRSDAPIPHSSPPRAGI